MSAIIKLRPGQSLNGVRFWRQDMPHCTPRFEVFAYVGYDTSKGLHLFTSVRNKCLITKGNNQLDVNGFHPFLLPGGGNAAA
jgi:hypothetical protein